jgi:hypothetical protein
VPGALTNVCLVVPYARGEAGWRDPAALLRTVVSRDVRLAGRFTRAELVEGPQVLGPMAVDASACGMPGLLMAGDAAGFIDPITGDGLRFALEGGVMAAGVLLETLAGRVTPDQAPSVLADRRHHLFGRKWRFNRSLRTLLTRPLAVGTAAATARVWPSAFRAVIRYAGDVHTVPMAGLTPHSPAHSPVSRKPGGDASFSMHDGTQPVAE